jgi:SagB-type dehydrogenase family enzyme
VIAQQYHDGSKHHFTRFAKSLGYLDWASQPNPFRSFGVPAIPLPAGPDRCPASPAAFCPGGTYDRLFATQVPPPPVSVSAVGQVLRYGLGLSAWKRAGDSRWALRVNPSSGNLHPTEAYVVVGPLVSVVDTPAVYHYAPDRHALELRCRFDVDAWAAACGDPSAVWLVALTSIHWRESWKYGERAFRYCQHDLGHAVAAVRLAAALAGWRVSILPQWSHRAVAAITGIDRDDDFVEAEREEPGCVLAVTAGGPPPSLGDGWPLADAIRRGRWAGRASQLSDDHVEWTFIEEIAHATADPGRRVPGEGRPERSDTLPVPSRDHPGPPQCAGFRRTLDDERRRLRAAAVTRDTGAARAVGRAVVDAARAPGAVRAPRRRVQPGPLRAGTRPGRADAPPGGVPRRVLLGARVRHGPALPAGTW